MAIKRAVLTFSYVKPKSGIHQHTTKRVVPKLNERKIHTYIDSVSVLNLSGTFLTKWVYLSHETVSNTQDILSMRHSTNFLLIEERLNLFCEVLNWVVILTFFYFMYITSMCTFSSIGPKWPFSQVRSLIGSAWILSAFFLKVVLSTVGITQFSKGMAFTFVVGSTTEFTVWIKLRILVLFDSIHTD